ncbi:MAG: 4Fe-4S dicluster domain-containing protein [Dissulfurispiraceae bacterium]|jgi:heterodisulfide reductase subunit C|nr:4Fe-4S dicluster domain-containing protein [Dissulfurispiraceae bacterium]
MPDNRIQCNIIESGLFLSEVAERSGQNISACYQCRRCAAGCPVGMQAGVTPDRLIRMITLGQKHEALNNLLVWKCVACYTCGVRCPNNIQTARITETLKQMAKEAGIEPIMHRTLDFNSSFMQAAGRLGRFNELEGMTIYETKTILRDLKKGDLKSIIKEIKDRAELGLAMFQKKRLHTGFERIKRLSEVKNLYKKAGFSRKEDRQ